MSQIRESGRRARCGRCGRWSRTYAAWMPWWVIYYAADRGHDHGRAA